MNFAEELNTWQNRCGLTQDKAARKLDVGYSTYRNWLSGRNTPHSLAMPEIRKRMSKVENTFRPAVSRTVCETGTSSPDPCGGAGSISAVDQGGLPSVSQQNRSAAETTCGSVPAGEAVASQVSIPESTEPQPVTKDEK